LSILSRRSIRRGQEKNLVGDKKFALSLGGGFLNKKKIERILNHNKAKDSKESSLSTIIMPPVIMKKSVTRLRDDGD
jgi:hypothetical protein